MNEDHPKVFPMPRSALSNPKILLQKMFMTLLEEHDILTGYPKDCSCKTHTGPHAIAESRQQLRHNFSVIIELMDKEQIPESLYRCFSNMLEFSEAERHRHGILIKNLKFYANDFFPKGKPEFPVPVDTDEND